MTSTLREGQVVGKTKMRCYRSRVGVGLASVLDVQSLFFLSKKIGFTPWPDIMLIILINTNQQSTVKPSFNDTIALFVVNERVLILNVTWFCFCFDFIHLHAPCGCCSIVHLRFQVVQIRQVYSKQNIRNLNNYK